MLSLLVIFFRKILYRKPCYRAVTVSPARLLLRGQTYPMTRSKVSSISISERPSDSTVPREGERAETHSLQKIFSRFQSGSLRLHSCNCRRPKEGQWGMAVKSQYPRPGPPDAQLSSSLQPIEAYSLRMVSFGLELN